MSNSDYTPPPGGSSPAEPGPFGPSPRPAAATFERPKIGPFWWTVIALGILAALLMAAAEIWTDVLWLNQVGYSQVFWNQWIAKVVLFVIGTLLVGGVVGLNLWLAWRARRTYEKAIGPDSPLYQYSKQIQPLRRLAFWGIVIAAGAFFGTNLASHWQTVLLFFNQTPFGDTDPQFNMDVSFYVFTLPFLRLVTSMLMTAAGLSLVAVAIVAYLFGGLSISQKFQMAPAVRTHVGILAAVMALVGAVNLWLDRYSLLVEEGDRFAGAGFTAVNAGIPGKTILAGIMVLIAALFIYAAIRGTWRIPIAGLAVMVVASLVVGVAYPALMQRFSVDPNAVEKESEFIFRNMEATRAAYGLEDVITAPYDATTEVEPGQLRADSESTAQIRLWDPSIADQTFRQYQQSRQYYDFSSTLSVDRYEVDGVMHDTVIAVRELNQNGLGADQRTWVNDHTVYTHGFGVVAAYGNQTAGGGRPRAWEQGVPSTGLLPEYEQRVYFGAQSPTYSIVGAPEGTEPWEFDYPDDNAENQSSLYTYQGDGGPSLGNLFNQVLYAIKFQDFNILFSDRVTSESQILYNRHPQLRVAEVAPFLTLDGRMYPAVVDMDDDESTPARLVWIVDGYTTTNEYPYSARETLTDVTQTSQSASILTTSNEVNYMRNSVKAVVDAYDGSVILYEWDRDPILTAWEQVFPGIITPTSEISGDLMSHMRYPEDLFKVQRELLTRYHVDSAAAFYSGNDFWAVPNDPIAGESVPQPPYYMTLQMPDDDETHFSLTTAFIPGGQSGRQILTGFMSVNADAGNTPGEIAETYGQIQLLELPRDLSVPGPGQVQNMFNAEPTVSSQLNLLQQGGSEVLRGNLLTLPVGGGLLYVQPVYTQSSGGTQVPLLTRVLVAFGEEIGFAPTLQEALDQIFGGDSGAETADAEAVDVPIDGEDPVQTTAEERLREALDDAAAAITAGNDAMAAGDWAAYGQAQEDLQQALEDAIAAESEISGLVPLDEMPGATDGATDAPVDGATDAPADGATEGTNG